MLIPDNIHPKNTVYYNGAIVLEAIPEEGGIEMLLLYEEANVSQSITMPLFVLCLDWLFLLDLIEMDSYGRVSRCT